MVNVKVISYSTSLVIKTMNISIISNIDKNRDFLVLQLLEQKT